MPLPANLEFCVRQAIISGSINAGRRLKSLASQHGIDHGWISIVPAASCCSEVDGRDLSSWRDFSAALRRSLFFRLASVARVVSSLASSVELIAKGKRLTSP